jgi:hypothetical protein
MTNKTDPAITSVLAALAVELGITYGPDRRSDRYACAT